MTTRYFLESVDRVMQVLNAFDAELTEPRLTDLSVKLGMPKPQVLRIVSTLETGGFVERDPRTKRYRLGLRMFQLGMLVRRQMNLPRIARPVMEQLAGQTQETVALFQADPSGPLCVDVIESPKGLRIFAQVGRTMPWNAGAAARAILANLPETERETIVGDITFQEYTPTTLLSPEALRRSLAETREAGYALSDGDLDADAFGISAPIFDANQQLVGALSIGGPRSRLADDQWSEVIGWVTDGAAEVSRRFGFTPAQAPTYAAD